VELDDGFLLPPEPGGDRLRASSSRISDLWRVETLYRTSSMDFFGMLASVTCSRVKQLRPAAFPQDAVVIRDSIGEDHEVKRPGL